MAKGEPHSRPPAGPAACGVATATTQGRRPRAGSVAARFPHVWMQGPLRPPGHVQGRLLLSGGPAWGSCSGRCHPASPETSRKAAPACGSRRHPMQWQRDTVTVTLWSPSARGQAARSSRTRVACRLHTLRNARASPLPGAGGSRGSQTHVCVHTRSRRRRQCHGSHGPHSVFSWFSRGGGPARRCAWAGAKHSPALPREACGACRRPAGRGFLGCTGVSETGPAPRSTPRAPGAGSERADSPDRRMLHFQEKVRFPISTWLQPFRLEGCVPVRWSRRPLRCPGRSANVQLPGMRFVSCPFQPPPPSARQAEPDPWRPQVAPPAGGGA